MKGHLYKVTVEHLEDPKGNPVADTSLTFETRNHDDLFKIVESMKNKKMELDGTDATALAIGLKLFGEVMLNNRDNELFKQFQPQFREFIKQLKKS